MHRSEVIYQIYPASFYDANGDGHGDLEGITQKLDYIKGLGVNAVWISPFFLSPEGKRGDGGYAITDYKRIDPKFGRLGATQEELQRDFDTLIGEAHKRHLRVYTDFVMCHTADDHEWFEKSRNEDSEFKDFYVWHPGKEDGHGNTAPPNNWQSVFGGSAWKFDDQRREFYLHHFNDSQPALNHNNPAVQEAVCKEMEFWYRKGVDGLRLDALPYANFDPLYRDNPARTDCSPPPPDASRWEWQRHDFSMCQNAVDLDGRPAPNNTAAVVYKIRKTADRCSTDKKGNPTQNGKRILGEVIAGRHGGMGSMEEAANYLKPGGLDSCYTDSLLQFSRYPDLQDTGDDRGLGFRRLRHMLKESVRLSPDGRFGNSFSNHDFVMAASRMTDGVPAELHGTVIKQLLTLGATMPGDWYLYQGEELGKQQDFVASDKMKDLLPPEKSRDGARTPMIWHSEPPDASLTGRQREAYIQSAGFTTSDTPYLPTSERNRARAVDLQEKEPHSILNYTRSLIRMRRKNPALVIGSTKVLDTPEPVLAFVRESGNQVSLLAFNMSRHTISLNASDLHLGEDTLSKLHIPNDADIIIDAYGYTSRGLNGLDQNLASVRKRSASNRDGHTNTRIFTADLLFANQYVGDDVGAAIMSEYSLSLGQKMVIDNRLRENLARQCESEPSLGGSTAVTLTTLKRLLPDGIEVNMMGLCGEDWRGGFLKKKLQEAGINLLMDDWPEGMEKRTGVVHLIRNASGKSTDLAEPGTDAEGVRELLSRSPDMLDKAIAYSDIVYMPGSLIEKFGMTFTSRLLKSRWDYGKQLVLALPTQAKFGNNDQNLYRKLIESANVVIGSDEKLCEIYRIPAERPGITEGHMDEIKDKIQSAFRQRVLQSNGVKCPNEQVAFITRGSKPAWLITENICRKMPVIYKVSEVRTLLGAGEAVVAGFMLGYVKGLAHEQSAKIGLGLSAQKVQQKSDLQYLEDPVDSLNQAFLYEDMRSTHRAYLHT